jgi:hypothetical protein
LPCNCPSFGPPGKSPTIQKLQGLIHGQPGELIVLALLRRCNSSITRCSFWHVAVLRWEKRFFSRCNDRTMLWIR